MSAGALLRRWLWPIATVALLFLILGLQAIALGLPSRSAHTTARVTIAAALVLVLVATVLRVATEVALPAPSVVGYENRPAWKRWGSGTQLLFWGSVALILGAVALSLPADAAVPLAALSVLTCLLLTVVALGNVLSERRGGTRTREQVKDILAAQAPDALMYVGRADGGRYQVEKWLDVLTQVHERVLIVVRSAQARDALASLTSGRVSAALLPRQRDLDVLPLDTLRLAYYPGSSSANANMISYRQIAHVYLGHGDSDKEVSTHPSHRMYDRVFVAGDAAMERYRSQAVSMPPGSLVKVGRPGLTLIAGGVEASARPATVLYAPTWEGYNSASTLSSLPEAERIVGWLCDAGVRVVFRPHPLSFASASGRLSIARADRRLAADGTHHVGSSSTRSERVEESIAASDALVTDVSSMLVEYLPHGGRVGVISLSEHADVTRFPTTAWATVLRSAEDVATWLETDPLAQRRDAARRHYISSTDLAVFEAAVRAVERSLAGRHAEVEQAPEPVEGTQETLA